MDVVLDYDDQRAGRQARHRLQLLIIFRNVLVASLQFLLLQCGTRPSVGLPLWIRAVYPPVLRPSMHRRKPAFFPLGQFQLVNLFANIVHHPPPHPQSVRARFFECLICVFRGSSANSLCLTKGASALRALRSASMKTFSAFSCRWLWSTL